MYLFEEFALRYSLPENSYLSTAVKKINDSVLGEEARNKLWSPVLKQVFGFGATYATTMLFQGLKSYLGNNNAIL